MAYAVLAPTYFFPSFIVPWWWWNMANICFLAPPVVLLLIAICQDLASGTTRERVSTLGFCMIFWVILLLALFLVIAGNFISPLNLGALPAPRSAVWKPRVLEQYSAIQAHVAYKAAGGENFRHVYSAPLCDMSTSDCSMKNLKKNSYTVLKPGWGSGGFCGSFGANHQDHQVLLLLKR